MRSLLCVVLVACVSGPGKNEVTGKTGRTGGWTAKVTAATFDGNLTSIDLGPRVSVVIASCYAHARQKIGDHDHVVIELDHKAPTTGELVIADCTSKHVTATMSATFADGTKLEAAIDTDLARK